MAKAKKKAAKTPARKSAKKAMGAKRRSAARANKKGGGRKSAPRRAAASPRRAVPEGVQLGVSVELDERLRALATQMDKSLEEILIQALSEFADNWEDHLRTVRALNAGDDRIQLVAPTDDAAR